MKKSKGFTLKELIIVLVIIAVLGVLAFGDFSGSEAEVETKRTGWAFQECHLKPNPGCTWRF